MGIRALCAAAAVAVGVGSAAEAATYTGAFTLVSAYESHHPFGSDPVEPDRPMPGYWNVATGDTVEAFITVIADFGDSVHFTLGTLTETIFSSVLQRTAEGYSGVESGYFYGWESLTWDGTLSGTISYASEEYPWAKNVFGSFTLAPVPLPAAAALLPLGLGALALMRRRRRVS
ncbi:VPLPA-CTERM sorting domain-containing protein [Paracoccus sp. 22332]|uniref:VPLPA-CTERM sorting domain-containing protein n=1 Tax=Paracoccus sp. 22332 TaxID=3453913 RepID=UPI003F84C511